MNSDPLASSDHVEHPDPHWQVDTLLGEQYRELSRRHTLDPEKRLMLAILEDGVKSFQASSGAVSGVSTPAEEWIFRDDPEWPFSFDNVCEFLDIDPCYLRSGLIRWKNTQPRERLARLKRLTESTDRRRKK